MVKVIMASDITDIRDETIKHVKFILSRCCGSLI